MTKHHVNPRYFLTPIAIAYYDLSGMRAKMVYCFGIRIIRIGLLDK
jgi:hypothetical protein